MRSSNDSFRTMSLHMQYFNPTAVNGFTDNVNNPCIPFLIYLIRYCSIILFYTVHELLMFHEIISRTLLPEE